MKIRSTLLAILGAGGGKAGAFPLGSSGDFSIVTSRNPDHQPSGPLALARAYLKYGQPLPDPLAAAIKALDKRWTGSVVATPVLYDVEYIVEAHLGTPAQKVMMNIDTGSSDFWVYSSETPPEILNGQSIYRPEKSRSAKRLDAAIWSIRYGDGSWSSGNVWIDNVSLGGLRIKGQALESATNASKSLTTDAAMSGILGLGFSKGNTVKPDPQLTFMDTARPHMRAPLFTANLNYHASECYRREVVVRSSFVAKRYCQTAHTSLAKSTRASTRARLRIRQSSTPTARTGHLLRRVMLLAAESSTRRRRIALPIRAPRFSCCRPTSSTHTTIKYRAPSGYGGPGDTSTPAIRSSPTLPLA